MKLLPAIIVVFAVSGYYSHGDTIYFKSGKSFECEVFRFQDGVFSVTVDGETKRTPASNVSLIEFSNPAPQNETPIATPSPEQPPPPPAPIQSISSSIATFSGTGAQNTRPFTTTGPWEVQWNARGDYFGAWVNSSDGEMVGIAANQQGSGRGTSYQPQAGRFYLEINAIGSWSVDIVPAE